MSNAFCHYKLSFSASLPPIISSASGQCVHPSLKMCARPGPRIRVNSQQPRPTESTPLVSESRSHNWSQMWSFARPYVVPRTVRLRILAVLALICVAMRKMIALVPPYALKLAIDSLSNPLAPRRTVPIRAIIVFIFSMLFANILNLIQDFCYLRVSVEATKRFSVNVFNHLQSLSLAFHLQRKTGEITRVMDRGMSSIETLTSTIVFTLLPTFLEVALVTSIFLHLGTSAVAASTLTTVVVYFAFTFVITGWRLKLRRSYIEADNNVSSKAVDSLMNYETVKIFGMEREEVSAFSALIDHYQKVFLRLRIALSSLNFSQKAIKLLGQGCAVLFAAHATTQGRLTVGDFVMINTYVAQLFQPLFFLGNSYRQITQASTDLEKCYNIFQEEITVQDSPDAENMLISESDVTAGTAGEVRFRNVSFKYTGGERGSSGGIKDMSFTAAPGKMVAFVGASGAGKSTIMRLLLRFYDTDRGSIEIDGTDIRTVTQVSLRSLVGVVAQDTILFNTTLRENIAYGVPDATDAQIMQAAQSAALGPLVESLPLGLDTMVGERGVRLSGGERQRVGCARCIIKRPAIVLLDEATSSLDTHTERELQNNLRLVCKNRTTLVIAHRLSTVMMADEIMVLQKDAEDGTGKIVERGTHEKLVLNDGVYASMWHAQTIGDASTTDA